MKKLLAAAAVAALVAPVAANAQAYVQAQIGLDSVSADGESEEGFAYGVAAGYDIPLSEKMFAGIEFSADESSTKQCVRDVFVIDDETCLKSGRDLAAVARLGTNLSASAQLYALAGYTNARMRLTYDDGTFSDHIGQNLDGFRLGAGFKQSLEGGTFLKVEYRYSNYESGISRHNALAGFGISF